MTAGGAPEGATLAWTHTGPPLLEVKGVGKRFPGVRALHQVDLHLGAGEVLALIGENGAGKSTLMKILAGIQRPDSGRILLDGEEVVIDSTRRATELGIALIHQELNLADNLSVGANIFLGREPRRLGWIDESSILRESRRLLQSIGADFSPCIEASRLSIGRQQMVEIAKALSVNARVLVMDEPTSSLSHHETEQLMRIVRELKSRGVSVIYISHRLGEVEALADRVSVLRDGENAGDLAREQMSHGAMVSLMVGRDTSAIYERRSIPLGDTVLKVQGLKVRGAGGHPHDFEVRAGEMVGIAGLVGAGRTELLETLFGVRSPAGGTVEVAGVPVKPGNPRAAIAAGLALVPEDRKQQGLFLEMSVAENLGFVALRRDHTLGFVDRAKAARLTRAMIERLGVKTPSGAQLVQFLSGGNQQKVVLAKWLAMEPRVLFLDEPTRGIDVGARHEIYQLMEALAEQGLAIVFVSSEMEEILGVADRVLVMHEGRNTGSLSRAELSEQAVMHRATGGDALDARSPQPAEQGGR